MAKGQNITVSLRKVSTGYRVTQFAMDDLDHAYSIATVLLRSQEYSRCFAIALSWQGDQVFHLTPEQVTQGPAPYCAPIPPQAHGYAPPGYAPQPQYPPALPQYAQPYPQQGYPPHPQGYPPQQPVYQAEVVEDFPAPPGFPQLPPPRRR